jgi:hypothetical protein
MCDPAKRGLQGVTYFGGTTQDLKSYGFPDLLGRLVLSYLEERNRTCRVVSRRAKSEAESEAQIVNNMATSTPSFIKNHFSLVFAFKSRINPFFCNQGPQCQSLSIPLRKPLCKGMHKLCIEKLLTVYFKI